MKIYTIQLGKWRRAKELGIELIDTTVKSGEPEFAPTWEMVKGVKEGTLSEGDYTKQYIQLMKESMLANRAKWEALIAKEEFALACYCKSGCFCHRYILKDIVSTVARTRGIPVEYCGEII